MALAADFSTPQVMVTIILKILQTGIRQHV